MLETFVYNEVKEVENVIFQQNGAPPHFGLRVRKSLDKRFQGQWIGRGGPIPWPTRSPDVTPLDFFLLGLCGRPCFNTPVRDVDELKQKITDAVATVNLNMLANTWRELRRRLEFLQDNNGRHIEVYKCSTA